MKCLFILLLIVEFLLGVNAWDNDDLELFDLVEEVGQNFYEFLGVNRDATNSEIRKAYHKLSLLLHPDKNKEEEAEKKFRQLVSIYDVLRDESKRQKYNSVLEQGLPDWRQPVFYYRRVRKFGLLEIGVLFLIIATVIHFIVSWAAYWERKYELEEVMFSRLRKKEKKAKKKKQDIDEDRSLIEDEIKNIPKPKLQNLLPLQLIVLTYKVVIYSPQFVIFLKNLLQAYLNPPKPVEDTSDEEPVGEEEQFKRPKRNIVLSNYEYGVMPDYPSNTTSFEYAAEEGSSSVKNVGSTEAAAAASPSRKGMEWTKEELTTLPKLMTKFPVGTTERWDKIAVAMQRSSQEVAKMAKELKSTSYSVPTATKTTGFVLEHIAADVNGSENPNNNNNDNNSANVIIIKGGDKREDNENSTAMVEDTWSQTQQKALEVALKQFPKGVDSRWDRIAECVPSKNKDECFQRYKKLVEFVRQKKTADR